MAQQMITEQAYSASVAAVRPGPRTVGHMTVFGVFFKSLVLFVVTCIFAGLGWVQASHVIHASSGPSWLLGYMLLIALSFLAISRPHLAPLGGLVYAVLMGWWVGGISHTYEVAYDGIVAQALLATMATVLVCLLLYVFRLVKVGRRLVLVVVAATLAIGVVYLVGWILALFGTHLRFWTHPTPAGTVISIVICIVAALSLLVDFAVIDTGVHDGAPKFMEWYSAWGLLATVVWLYLEVLYLLARLRR